MPRVAPAVSLDHATKATLDRLEATARAAAKNARMHVREFREAAMNGDAAGARDHASQAMQFVTQLIDWST